MTLSLREQQADDFRKIFASNLGPQLVEIGPWTRLHPLAQDGWLTIRDTAEALFAPQWRPISEAPSNQTILVYLPNFDHYGHGVLRAILVDMGTGQHWLSCGWHVGRDIRKDEWPTHFMPLPESPK